MKLFWSSRSPFARKVMVVAHEVGVADRIDRQSVVVSPINLHAEVSKYNPFGKIPTLILDDGSVLYDSIVICQYFDTLHQGEKLFPAEQKALFGALKRHAAGNQMMETLLQWLGERFRKQPEESEIRIDGIKKKITNALDTFENDDAFLAKRPFDIGDAAIGVALSYMDFRFDDAAWRNGHDKLARWHADFSARPSVIATAFVDERTEGFVPAAAAKK